MPRPPQNSDIKQQISNDMQRKLDSLNGTEKIKALLDFCYLCTQIEKFTTGLDVKLLTEYLSPKNPGTNELDTEKTKERFNELMEFRCKTVYKGFMDFIKENPGHSDKWYREVYSNTNKNFNYNGVMENTLIAVFEALDDPFTKAFPELKQRLISAGEGPCIALAEDAHKKAFASLLDTLTDPEDKKCLEKAGQLMQKSTDMTVLDPKYQEQQKILKVGETYPTADDEYKLFCEERRNLDISFLSNDILKVMLKDNVREMYNHNKDHKGYFAHIDPPDYNNKKNAMLQKSNEQSQKFNSTKSFWHINSDEYKEVKKKIKKLNEEIDKGGKVIEALEGLETACQKYLIKNMNKGKKELGKKRKAVISEIYEFAKQEKAKMNSSLTISEKWISSVRAREDARNRNDDAVENQGMKKTIDRAKTFGEKMKFNDLTGPVVNNINQKKSSKIKKANTNQLNIKK